MMSENRGAGSSYTVKHGDSFYLIAQRLGVRLQDLMEANPDIPPARLMVGDVLRVPSRSGTHCPAGDARENTPDPGNNNSNSGGSGYVCPANRRAVIQEGQTASDLQLRYNLSYHTLKTANSDRDLENLRGGDILCIPENNISCPLPASVVLGDNDTLESVAMMYNVPIASLLRVNPCLAPEDFTAGATVRLPD